MRRILSKQAAWYENGRPVNINPSRWEGDAGIGKRPHGPKTEEDVEAEGWGQKPKSDKKKHKMKCPCGDKCRCGDKCKCRKS